MSVLHFPLTKSAVVQPCVEIYAPSQTATGLYEVFVWKNRDRDEGFMVRVKTLKAAMQVLRIVKQSFKGAAHG